MIEAIVFIFFSVVIFIFLYFTLDICGGKIKFKFFIAWYDAWVGIYYDRKKTILYIIPIPMLVLSFSHPRNDWIDGRWVGGG